MKVIMDDLRLTNIDQIREFLKGGRQLILRLETIEEKYQFIDETVDRFFYHNLPKRDKRVILKYLKKITGYKRTQLFRLIERAIVGELIRQPYKRKTNYRRIYTPYDIKLLEKTDELHLKLSSPATHEILRREYEIFHHAEFKNIAGISISHINNLRESNIYSSSWFNHTKARVTPIGETTKPDPNGFPGSIRIDTVHQRDVFHINAVDEITQWEIIICVPQISELYLKPALELLLAQYPFVIFNFHSDRGGEFINYVVAKLLNKLLIHQTKSRSRHCNDNALVEGKNGSVIRKNMGYGHINQQVVNNINDFYFKYFHPYLNFHRPCGYVTEIKKDFKGREKKIYGQYTMPYEKLKEISKEKNKNFLKPDESFEKIDIIAYRYSDNQWAEIVRKKQNELFELNMFFHGKV